MSRSKRKHSIVGNGGGSEKYEKRLYNRILRTKTKLLNKNLLIGDVDEDDVIYPEKDEIKDIWDMGKDSKRYIEPGSKWFKEAIRK